MDPAPRQRSSANTGALPAGIASPCIYLKHAKQWAPNALRRVEIQEKPKVGEYLVADTIEAVVSLAQMGIVELHTWNSTDDDLERPNRIVWISTLAPRCRGRKSSLLPGSCAACFRHSSSSRE